MARPVNLHGRPLDRCTIFGSVPERNARIQSGEQVLLFVNFRIYARRSPKGPEKAPIYIVQSERTTNSHRKMKQSVFKFKHGVPSTEEAAGHKLSSSHALAVSARSLAVGDSEIYALLLNNG